MFEPSVISRTVFLREQHDKLKIEIVFRIVNDLFLRCLKRVCCVFGNQPNVFVVYFLVCNMEPYIRFGTEWAWCKLHEQRADLARLRSVLPDRDRLQRLNI